MKKISCIFAAAFLATQTAVAEEKTLVFLGDSLTAGYGLAEGLAYPALIQAYLEKDGLPWKVVNAGISGDTTRGGLQRLDWVLRSKPRLVFVALGANDGLRGFKLAETRGNLDAILGKLQKAGVRAAMAGMQLPTNYGTDYRRQFQELFPSVAKKRGVPLLPFLLDGVAMRPELNQADGIHPTEQGQEIMAKEIYKFLKPMLSADGQPAATAAP